MLRRASKCPYGALLDLHCPTPSWLSRRGEPATPVPPPTRPGHSSRRSPPRRRWRRFCGPPRRASSRERCSADRARARRYARFFFASWSCVGSNSVPYTRRWWPRCASENSRGFAGNEASGSTTTRGVARAAAGPSPRPRRAARNSAGGSDGSSPSYAVPLLRSHFYCTETESHPAFACLLPQGGVGATHRRAPRGDDGRPRGRDARESRRRGRPSRRGRSRGRHRGHRGVSAHAATPRQAFAQRHLLGFARLRLLPRRRVCVPSPCSAAPRWRPSEPSAARAAETRRGRRRTMEGEDWRSGTTRRARVSSGEHQPSRGVRRPQARGGREAGRDGRQRQRLPRRAQTTRAFHPTMARDAATRTTRAARRPRRGGRRGGRSRFAKPRRTMHGRRRARLRPVHRRRRRQGRVRQHPSARAGTRGDRARDRGRVRGGERRAHEGGLSGGVRTKTRRVAARVAASNERELDPRPEREPDVGESSARGARRVRERRVGGVVVDLASPFRVHRSQILELLHEHLRRNVVRSGGVYLLQTVGIPQGSVLSTLLCAVFYANLESTHGLTRDERGADERAKDAVLCRWTDDLLHVSAEREPAEAFLSAALAGFAEYGCAVNPSKTSLNFDFAPAATDSGAVPPAIPRRETSAGRGANARACVCVVRVAHRQSHARDSRGLRSVRRRLGARGCHRARARGLGALRPVRSIGSTRGGVPSTEVHGAAVRPLHQLAARREAQRVPVVPARRRQDALFRRRRQPERKTRRRRRRKETVAVIPVETNAEIRGNLPPPCFTKLSSRACGTWRARSASHGGCARATLGRARTNPTRRTFGTSGCTPSRRFCGGNRRGIGGRWRSSRRICARQRCAQRRGD